MTQDQNEENKAIQDDEPDPFETPARTDGKESDEDTEAENTEKE
ncbi:hypothetical protein [Paenibacillus sp. OK003]|nr:hypothetical protein [Paenibacillus sp. OK003]SEK41607.1 hypothetical protein SAMN05518856_10277 [Paenibacillus sp. OK003]